MRGGHRRRPVGPRYAHHRYKPVGATTAARARARARAGFDAEPNPAAEAALEAISWGGEAAKARPMLSSAESMRRMRVWEHAHRRTLSLLVLSTLRRSRACGRRGKLVRRKWLRVWRVWTSFTLRRKW